MNRVLARAVWASVYLVALFGPVALSWAIPGNTLMERMAVGSGLLVVSALVCTVVLPSRLRSLTRTFGVEQVLGAHRWLGLFVTWAVGAHVWIVLAENPNNIDRLNLLTGPRAGRAGTVAALALLVSVGWASRQVRDYERWRVAHALLAAAVVAAAGLHVWWLGNMVAHPVMRLWLALQASAVAGVIFYRWVWRRYLPRSAAYVVREVRAESLGVFTLVLEQPGNRHRPIRFAPGQFVWLRLRPSLWAEQHPFTIASSATRAVRLCFTIRETGGFTTRLAKLQPGTRVWLDGPHGSFSLDHHPTTGLVLIAGGVGITPMMSMLRTLADRGDRKPHRLIAVARTPDELLFSDELATLSRRLNL